MKTHIKYRVWDVDNKEFVNDMCIHTDGTLMCDCGKTGYFQKFIVQQFTGLVDQFGKDIYEGDIVSYDTVDIYPFRGVVEFWNCTFIAHEKKANVDCSLASG